MYNMVQMANSKRAIQVHCTVWYLTYSSLFKDVDLDIVLTCKRKSDCQSTALGALQK